MGAPAEWQGKAMFEWHRRKQSAGGIARRPQYTIELTYTVEVYPGVYYPNTNTFESGTHEDS